MALYRHEPDRRAELLPTRRDLFNYEGGYGWGYGGSGPQNLAHAIAGRIFLLENLSDKELQQRARVILDKVISLPTLDTDSDTDSDSDSDSDHDVPVDAIKQLFV